jgi:tetratricopeptide (TPR) repeat protein
VIVSGLNLGGDATRAAAEGQAALSVGDTDRARERFGVAGDILEGKIASLRKQSDKHLTRFLAASQYYHGGHYQKALSLARKVEARLLPSETRPVFDKFFRDVNERAGPDYEAKARKQLVGILQRKEYEAVLAWLQSNPYSLKQAETAFLRGVSCERLKDYRAASLFFADAVKGFPDNPRLLFALTALPLLLSARGDFDEAWKYVQYQLKEIPHAVTCLTASLVRFHQAVKALDVEQQRLFDEQIDYFEEGRRRFQQLPEVIQKDQDLRDFMVLCFESASLALNRWGDPKRARAVCDEGVAFAPKAYGPRTMRGIISYPEEGAVNDFRESVRLGDQHYYPYYYLAHAAIMAKDIESAESWCQQALRRRPRREIEAQLHLWLAIALHHLGSRQDEVLYQLALARGIDSANAWIGHDMRSLEEQLAALPQIPAEPDPDYVTAQEVGIVDKSDRFPTLSRELAGVS